MIDYKNNIYKSPTSLPAGRYQLISLQISFPILHPANYSNQTSDSQTNIQQISNINKYQFQISYPNHHPANYSIQTSDSQTNIHQYPISINILNLILLILPIQNRHNKQRNQSHRHSPESRYRHWNHDVGTSTGTGKHRQ